MGGGGEKVDIHGVGGRRRRREFGVGDEEEVSFLEGVDHHLLFCRGRGEWVGERKGRGGLNELL